MFSAVCYLTVVYHSFITYRAVPHLDRKHTIFGKVVGGLNVLDRLEVLPTDSNDRPVKDITINEIVVFVDPFEEWKKQQKEKEDEDKAEELRNKEETDDQKTTWTGKRLRDDRIREKSGAREVGVGRYIQAGKAQPLQDKDELIGEGEPYYEELPKKKMKPSGGFGDFSSW